MMVKYRGAKLARIVKSLEEKHQIVLDDNFILSYRTLVEELFEENLKPIEGVIKVLENINLSICVASSRPIKKVEQTLSLTGLKSFFNGNLFSSYEVGSWKPEPDLFLHVAKEMGFSPKECAVVEGSPLGIEAALAAKMYPIFYNPKSFYKSIRGSTTIKHMGELQHVIT